MPHNHQFFLTVLCIDLHPSLMSLLPLYLRLLLESAPLSSSKLSPSAIAEANTAVNGVQQAKTKKQGPYVYSTCSYDKNIKYSSENGVHAGVAYSFDGSIDHFLVSIWHSERK